jgi:phage tail-like protein
MPNEQLFTNFAFELSIPDISTVGRFSMCSGLELSFEIYQYQEGGNNDFIHRLPGALHYPNLVLTHGLTSEEALFKWFWATHTKAERKEVTLTLSSGQTTRSWTFAEAFPVRWSGPQVCAGSGEVATETLEIAHSGLKLA